MLEGSEHKLKTIKIKPFDNFDIYFNLVLCKTLKQMRTAIKKHDPDYKHTGQETALFSHNVYLTHDKHEGKFYSNCLGVMFLNLDDLKSNEDILIHEAGHCALSFYNHVLRYSGNFNSIVNHAEYYFFGEGKVQEAFCYFLSFVYKKVWQEIKLYKKELSRGVK